MPSSRPTASPTIPHTWSGELRALLSLAIPLAAAYAGNHLMGLVDTAIVGRLGTVELAGTGLGHNLFSICALVGTGILMGLDPLLSQAMGAGQPQRAHQHYREGLWLSLLIALCFVGLPFGLYQTLGWMQIEAPVQQQTWLYLLGRAPGMLPALFYITFRGYLQSQGMGRPVLLSTLLANLVNIPLSMWLCFDPQTIASFGLPFAYLGCSMGVTGAGLASTIVSMLQALFLCMAITHRVPKPEHVSPSSWQGMRKLLHVGWPIALHLLTEVGIFLALTLLMGRFGAAALAGHQVALQLVSFTFTLCIGIGSATSVRVGYAIGQSNPSHARTAGFLGIGLGVLVMSASALNFLLFAKPISQLFAKPNAVVAAAVPLLYVAGLFQIVDGIQAVAAGALRGLGDTRIIMWANLVGHWCLAFPLIYWFAQDLSNPPSRLWLSLTIGLSTVAIILTYRLWHMTQKTTRLKPLA